MNDATKRIKDLLRKDRIILFVGAGIPRTLGLPNWEGLMNLIAEKLGFDEEIFKLYGDYMTLAEYYSLLRTGNIQELAEWMRREWSIDPSIVAASEIYSSIVQLNCSTIYTTNYDDSLEKAFVAHNFPVKTIIGVQDLVDLAPGTTRIIKYHGDLTDSTSMVLTESDYFRRMSFESPLDITLRADMLGKSIVFIGYSLSDINIRYLIFKLDSLWRDSGQIANRPESFILLNSPNPIQEAIFKNRGITPIVCEDTNRTHNLTTFLRGICE